ncbi:MAG: transporter substrate-binding domain-containing protein [Firmicutes bacterium]|nr:transporter substrate-binding domain-containing protein [Bacillota bacterium]
MLAAVMLLGLAACGGQKYEGESGEIIRFKTVSKDKLTLAVSPDFIPMVFIDLSKEGDEQFAGFDMTLARYIASGLELELVIEPMSLSACMEAVSAGKADISISGYGWTSQRAHDFFISDPYYAGDGEKQQSIICLKANEGKWTEKEALSGMKIGVQKASLQQDLAKEQLPPGAEIKLYEAMATAVKDLLAGTIDGICVTHGNGEDIIAANSEIAFSGFDFDVSEQLEGNIILLNRKSEELGKAINDLLAKAYNQNLYADWYQEAKDLALSENAKEQSYDADGKPIE